MKNKISFCRHFFPYLIVLAIIITSVVSYYHFIIKSDYSVEYEGVCDPITEKCFSKCSDDACEETEYYSIVQKYAPDLYRECGKDITGCEAANKCLSEDMRCSVTYCDPGIDGDVCATSTPEVDSTEGVNLASSTVDSLLLDNTNDNSL